MPPYFQIALTRREYFLTASMVKKCSLEQPKSVVIAGRAALKLLWDDWEKLDNKTLQSAAQFRRFAWMLDVRQMSKVNDLVRDQVRTMTAAAMKDSVRDVPFPGRRRLH